MNRTLQILFAAALGWLGYAAGSVQDLPSTTYSRSLLRATNAAASLRLLGAPQQVTAYSALPALNPDTGAQVVTVQFANAPDLTYRAEATNPGYGWPLVATNSSSGKFWVARPGYVLADWCGAAGDGTTDDTAALAAAVACSYLSGYEVRLAGNKTYLVDNVDVVDPPVGWTFDGQGGTLKKSVSAEDVVFQVRAGTAHTEGVTIRNVTIDGNGQEQTTEKAGLAGFYYPVENILQTVAVVPAQGNTLVGIGIGFTENPDFNHYFASVQNVTVQNCGGSGVYVEPGAVASLRVENLALSRCVQHGVSFGTASEVSVDLQIEGIRAEYCGSLFDLGGTGNTGKTTLQVRNGYAYQCWGDSKISAPASGIVSGLTFVECGSNPRTEYAGLWDSQYSAPFRVYPQTQSTLVISDVSLYRCAKGLELADVLADNLVVDSSKGMALTLISCVANNLRVYNTDGVYGGAVELNGSAVTGLSLKSLKFDPVAMTNQLGLTTQPFTHQLYVSGPARGTAAGGNKLSDVLIDGQYCTNGLFGQSWGTNLVVEGLRFVGTASGTSGNNIAGTAQLAWTSYGDYLSTRNDSLLLRSCDFGNLTNATSAPFLVYNRRSTGGGVYATAVRTQDCQGPILIYDPSPNVLLTPPTAGAAVTSYMSVEAGAGLYAATDLDSVVRVFHVDTGGTNRIVNDVRSTLTTQRTTLDDSTDILAQVGSSAPTTIGSMDTEADWTESVGTDWAWAAGEWTIGSGISTLTTTAAVTGIVTSMPRRYDLVVTLSGAPTNYAGNSVVVRVGGSSLGYLANAAETTFTGVRVNPSAKTVEFVASADADRVLTITSVTLKVWATADLLHEHTYAANAVTPNASAGPTLKLYAAGTTAANANNKTLLLAWSTDTGTPAIFEELTTAANDKPWTVEAVVSALTSTNASWSGVFTVDGTPQAFARYNLVTTNFAFNTAGYIYVGGNADTADGDLLVNQSELDRKR